MKAPDPAHPQVLMVVKSREHKAKQISGILSELEMPEPMRLSYSKEFFFQSPKADSAC
jgi:hypothetical protein